MYDKLKKQNGEAVTGSVNIELIEIYKKADMTNYLRKLMNCIYFFCNFLIF